MLQLKKPWKVRWPSRMVSQAKVLAYLLILTLLLLACNVSGVEPIQNTDTPIPTPTSLPQPSATPSKVPQPTATLAPSPLSTYEVEPTPCKREFFFRPAPPLCPIGDPQVSLAAEQPFEGGVMIWLESADSIYVFYKDQRWKRYDDLWNEEQINSDPTIVPPADRFQPIRGFGKVWRENQTVRDKLGWALGFELGFNTTTQESVVLNGASILFIGAYNGQVFALTSHGIDEGDWVIASS